MSFDRGWGFVFLFFAFMFLTVFKIEGGLDTTTYMSVVGGVSASFVGAWFAFSYNAQEKFREVEAKRLASARLALFIVTRQLRFVSRCKGPFDEKVNEPFRFLLVKPFPVHDLSSYSHDFRSLDFLVSPSEQLLMYNLHMLERLFYEAMDCIDERSKLLNESIFPVLSSLNITTIQQIGSRDDFQVLVGALHANSIIDLTDVVYENIRRVVDIGPTVRSDLLVVLKNRFPGEHFVDLDPFVIPVE